MPVKGPSLDVTHPVLANEWHPGKNGALSPANVTLHSKLDAWWLCSKNKEHIWKQRVDQRVIQKECPECTIEINSLLTLFPDVAKEWHQHRNENLAPNTVSGKSSKKVWWQCPTNLKHEWQAKICNRTHLGHGCPFCKGRKVDDTNSLATKCPDLVKEWHPTKNGELRADQFTCGSHQQIWWLCAKTRVHEWKTAIKARTLKGYGCPECGYKRTSKGNTLSEVFPEIASEWHPSKNRRLFAEWKVKTSSHSKDERPRNRRLRPSDVPPYGSESVWWQCKNNSKHEWYAKISARTKNGTGCPYCAGKLASDEYNLEKSDPGLARHWHPTRNGKLLPSQVTPGSGKKVWWRCFKSATHVWNAEVCSVVWSRKDGASGCPFCRGVRISEDNNLQAKYPQVAKQWHPTRNLPLEPRAVAAGSDQPVWWCCTRSANHEFQAGIKAVVRAVLKGHSGCPFCKGRRVSEDNSLAARYPQLLPYWNYDRNQGVLPSELTHGSGKKVWWHCLESKDHEWERTVFAMVAYFKRDGALCPLCYANS